MTKIVHPNNRIYCPEGDEKLSSAVREVREIILTIGGANQRAVFQYLRKSREDPIENFNAVEDLLKLVMMIRKQDIINIISGKTNMSAEMVTHMALSEIDI